MRCAPAPPKYTTRGPDHGSPSLILWTILWLMSLEDATFYSANILIQSQQAWLYIGAK